MQIKGKTKRGNYYRKPTKDRINDPTLHKEMKKQLTMLEKKPGAPQSKINI